MNGIQVTTLSGQQCNRLLDAVVTIPKYIIITIDHVIYIKAFFGGTVSFIRVSYDDAINTTNNETVFCKLKIVLEEHFEMKVQEGSVLKYLNF